MAFSNANASLKIPWSCEELNGRDALLRVHKRKPKPDAAHRVPTASGSGGKRNAP
jgi:hypothetical protein